MVSKYEWWVVLTTALIIAGVIVGLQEFVKWLHKRKLNKK